MMIVMKEGASEAEIAAVVKRVESVGAQAHLGASSNRDRRDRRPRARGEPRARGRAGRRPPGADPQAVQAGLLQYKREQRTVLEIEGRRIGGDHFATIAGPCTVESREVLLDAARTVKEAGAQFLRGARTSRGRRRTRSRGSARPAAPARRGEGRDRPADRDRADGRARPRAGARGGRRRAARRAQHAELHAAHRGRPRGQAGAFEARPVGDARGAPDGGGVR